MSSRRNIAIIFVVVVLAVALVAAYMATSPQQENTTSTTTTLSSTTTSSSTTAAQLVSILITEIELNPPGNELSKQWVELYNPNDFDVNLGGWKLLTTAGNPNTIVIPEGVTISADGFYIVNSTQKWLETKDEVIILRDTVERLLVQMFPPIQ